MFRIQDFWKNLLFSLITADKLQTMPVFSFCQTLLGIVSFFRIKLFFIGALLI